MIGGFHDSLTFLSKSDFRRLANATSVLSSFYVSRMNKRARIKGLPMTISIEPTTSCNLRCPECPSGLRSFTRATGMLDENLYRNIIDQLSPTLSYLTFYFQGEPFLHPQFLKMVQYANEKRIYTATSTNAHFLKDDIARETVESGLNRLIISIDGTTQDTYQSYRVGGTLEKVIEGTENILKWRRQLKAKHLHVVFQFLVVKPNEHQIPEVKRIGKKLGVDQVVLKTAQIYDYENGSELIPVQEKYSRYKSDSNGKFSIKNQLLDHCWKMWHSCVVTWDGKIVPCCFDKDAHFVLGDISKNSFEEIWFGEKYNVFRQTLLGARSEIEICKNCTEGTRVWG
jgi:radical SAM protein with 4Fe4S-binding SPASM domain